MDKSRTPEYSTKRTVAKTAFVVAAGLAALTGAQKMAAPEAPQAPLTADQNIACVPSETTQEFTFTETQGRMDAIHAIAGSGKGETDPCWSEAESIVKDALLANGDSAPHEEETIVIPQSIEPRP